MGGGGEVMKVGQHNKTALCLFVLCTRLTNQRGDGRKEREIRVGKGIEGEGNFVCYFFLCFFHFVCF